MVGHDWTPRLTNEDLWILSGRLLDRFERFGNLDDLQQAITILEQLLGSTPIWSDRYCAELADLGVALLYRFNHLGKLSDLEDAVSRLSDAIDLTPQGHPDRPARLNNLGTSFFARFKRFGELSDLQNAISRQKDAVSHTPQDHPDKPVRLNNLGISCTTRFEHLGQLGDIEDAISMLRDAVDLTPHSHPDKSARLSNLGNSFLVRFKLLGQLSDLEYAISRQSDAVVHTPLGHPHKSHHLNNLGISLMTRFQRLGQLSDLEVSISTLRDAVQLTPHDHPNKPHRLNNLSNSLFVRFKYLGHLDDLEHAISTQRDAVSLTPHGHPDKPICLTSLGTSFFNRFERLGELSDIEDAISTLRDAVDLTPHGHPHRPCCLNNLGNSFRTRFEHLGQPSDLEHAISTQRDAVDQTPHGHPDKHISLCNLGNSFFTRFEHFGELSDLDDAISRQKVAVDLTPPGDLSKPGHLSNLGNSFITRFEHLGQLTDLDDAILMQKDAVDLTPHGHPRMPVYLNNLGTSYISRFERTGKLGDLEDAILTLRDAVHFTPHGHLHKPRHLYNFGNCFRTRFKCLGELSDLERAISIYSHAALAPIGPIGDRLLASKSWISCARLIRHHSLLHACSVTLDVLPQLAWIGLSLETRCSQLTRAADVVREVAAAALDCGRPDTAVEWLEQGRSIIWGELFQLRSSYNELSSAHPDLAHRLHRLSVVLDHAGATHEKSLSTFSEQTVHYNYTSMPWEREGDKHRALAIERDKLLQEIRRLPGFERFLFRKQFYQLRPSAHSGPVVILNASETRCDALIVLADVDHVIHVPLPYFTCKRSSDLRNIMKHFTRRARHGMLVPQDGISWDSILSPLWKGIVRPVLDALAFTAPGDLSRVFWCPTGPLTFLPIHAAGLYDAQYSEPGHKVFDFVVSSYVPTLAILAPPPSPSTVSSGVLRLLSVRQPPSDGHFQLPGVIVEVEYIKDLIRNSPSSCTTLLESSEGTVEEVLGLMKGANWVHFACHGIQDGVDSGLCLANRRRLKLRDIIALSRPRGGLAFLSACQTATGEERLSDEAIHMAAGMLFAGYGGVVGTMWSISDLLAPVVARDVYARLVQNGTRPDYREAALALHEAIERLRDRDVSFDEWIPFIHVGL